LKTVGGFVSLVVLAALVLELPALADEPNWPRFRGPNGQGVSQATGIPVTWTEKDYNWKVALPGGGHSSPVVWGETIFVTCGHRESGRRMLAALRVSDGKILWSKDCPPVEYSLHGRNSYAAATPAVDADHVYALWTTPKHTRLVALDHEGADVWQSTFAGVHCPHGAAMSPIVVDDLVVFTREQEHKSPYPSSWVAVDRKMGKTRWELERQTSIKTGYSTPCLFAPNGRPPQLIFTSLAHGMTAVDPQTGKVVWGRAYCLRGATGEQLWQAKPGGRFAGSPVWVDGRLYCITMDGNLVVIRAADQYELLAVNPLGEKSQATPAVAGGRLYLRTESHLISIGG